MTQVFNAKNPTIAISVTDSASTAVSIPAGKNIIRVVNNGSNECFIAVGGSSVAATVPTGTAAVTATPVLSGADAVFSITPNVDTYISAICNTSETTTLYVSAGQGV